MLLFARYVGMIKAPGSVDEIDAMYKSFLAGADLFPPEPPTPEEPLPVADDKKRKLLPSAVSAVVAAANKFRGATGSASTAATAPKSLVLDAFSSPAVTSTHNGIGVAHADVEKANEEKSDDETDEKAVLKQRFTLMCQFPVDDLLCVG